jgi:asparagine synthase (glutamine-hydrolysing)
MTIENVRERMQVAIRALDQPSIDGINTYFVAEATAKAGLKVAVSGVGGDELFGGYETFKMIPRIEQARARLERFPGGGAVARAGAGALALLPRSQSVTRAGRVLQFGHDTAGAYYATRGLFSPHEVRALLAPQCRDAVEATAPVAELGRRVSAHELAAEERISALEFRQYLQCQLLRDTDATAMRHSLEVRTPLVDSVLLSAVTRVPAGIRQAGPAKKWLRESPRPKVPSDLWARKKQGFTLPFDSWLRSGGLSTALPEHPCLDAKGVESLKRDFNNGKVTWSRLWSLIVLREYLS